ncbi:MAG: 50S ribosomal protein L9 [Muribaculaceae bacterium]|nr:50S ribosomal protein L9 [Muribaculaceae bacterium]
MKLILKENVVELGYKDDVVEVKDGYGRNYLIPQGKAIIASDANLKELQENLRQRAHKIAAILAEAQGQADAIKDVKLVIEAKTGANGVIYGSVGAAQIADAFAKLGHTIDRKLISLKNPIKVIGDYVCTVKFHRDVNAEVPVCVVAEATEE